MKLKYIVFSAALLIPGWAGGAANIGVCVLDSCKTGYYMATTTATSCTACVTPGTSANPNKGDITSCYIPKNTDQTDSVGTYVYTVDCYYTK
ncbi:MAG: hypothetical protein LBJ73_01590 [Rickettsiales bacterium]|jgi:hypothetical protein|nr:hypothetical protein [Rickettsiales bacterium]